MKRFSNPVRYTVLALVLLLLPFPHLPRIAAQEAPDAAAAEEEADKPFGYRKYAFAAIGAVLGALPAYFADEPDDPRSCQSRECLMPLGGAVGGAIGYLVGSDLDSEAAERFAAGPDLRFRSRAIELGLIPAGVTTYNGGALVYGQSTLAVVARDARRVHTAAENLRGIMAAAAFPVDELILAGTTSGLYAFPLARSERADGRQVSDTDAVTTLEPIGFDALLMGGGEILRRLKLTGGFGDLALTEQAQVPVSTRFRDAAVSMFSGVLWTLSGDELVARTLTSLEPLSRVRLPAAGNSLTLSEGRAMITAGADGLMIVNIEDPEAPRLVGRVDGIPFAFDAVIRGDTAYIAAGQSGLVVADISNPARPRTLGVARNIGFASAVELAPGGGIYVVDKRGRRLILLELGATEPD